MIFEHILRLKNNNNNKNNNNYNFGFNDLINNKAYIKDINK